MVTRSGDLEIGVVVYPGEFACVRELMTNNMRGRLVASLHERFILKKPIVETKFRK